MVTTVVPEKPETPAERITAVVTSERVQLGLLLTLCTCAVALAPVPAGPLGAGGMATVAFVVGRRR